MPYDYPIKFGKYFLTRRIAVGGMAEVFKAKLVGIKGFEKTLALKKILPEYSEDEDFVQMFVDEARISSNLHHNNIVQVYDFGKVDTSYYIAMEYVDGPNLKNFTQRYLKLHSMFPRTLAFYIIMLIARALEYAHNVRIDGKDALNLIHRDVSPQNVLLSRLGDVKLTDFGIAKAEIKLSKTQPGKIQGKFSYMSPEQAMGKPLDRRSDSFSLGIITYEILTGVKVYSSEDTHQRYKEVREAQIPRLGTMAKDLPAEIESLIMSMVARDPEDRPATSGEIASKLSEYLSDISLEQLSSELGSAVDEIFPREISDPKVNQKIQAKIEGRITPDAGVHSQGLEEGFRILRPVGAGAEKEDTTVANWTRRLIGSRLVFLAALSILSSLFAAYYYFSTDRVVTIPSTKGTPTETPIYYATPRSGPIDPDLRAAASSKDAEAEMRLKSLEKKLKAAEEEVKKTQTELKKAEKKLERVDREDQVAVAPPKRSCPFDMLLISGGDFIFGSQPGDPQRNELVETTANSVAIRRFCIDSYEYPNHKGKMPKAGVTWNEAQALCIREGKRLCAQEEWERACKGPTQKSGDRRYTYGNTFEANRCNTEKRGPFGDTVEGKPAASGSFEKCMSPEGAFDMSGNLDEWTQSYGRFAAASHVTKGGSSKKPDWAVRCSSLREVPSTSSASDIGFRCCKDAL